MYALRVDTIFFSPFSSATATTAPLLSRKAFSCVPLWWCFSRRLSVRSDVSPLDLCRDVPFAPPFLFPLLDFLHLGPAVLSSEHSRRAPSIVLPSAYLPSLSRFPPITFPDPGINFWTAPLLGLFLTNLRRLLLRLYED